MKTPNYLVAVAGAGPAGCAAAIKLRQAGITVCLVDEVENTRFKVGESLPGAIIRLLRSLDISGIQELLPEGSYASCMANRSAWGTEKWSYTDAIHNPEGGGWHILRTKFDEALRERAVLSGVAIYKGKIKKAVKQEKGSGYTLSFKKTNSSLPETIKATFIIDATGRPSVLLKQLNIKRQNFEQQMAAVCWLQKTPEDIDATTTIKSVYNGWWYTSGLPDNTRVLSFHGLPRDVAAMVKSPELFFTELTNSRLFSYPVLQKNLVQGIRARDAGVSMARQVAGTDWFAVGDAALAFDPLSSQGIFFALYSGIKAAQTITSIQNTPQNAKGSIMEYVQSIKKVFDANQRSRWYFYLAEHRFPNSPYWQQYEKENSKIT